MANQYKNKVIYAGETLIDLTTDTVAQADVATGKYFHLPSGQRVAGTNTYDSNTTDATATAAEILATKTAYVNKNKVTGTMVNNGSVTGTISTKTQQYTVPIGYHDGSGKVSIASAEQAKIISDNIRQGITILGVEGSMTGTEDVNAEAVTATPQKIQQVITPSEGYNYISQVTVEAIPYTETDNAAGGVTVTIAGASA